MRREDIVREIEGGIEVEKVRRSNARESAVIIFPVGLLKKRRR